MARARKLPTIGRRIPKAALEIPQYAICRAGSRTTLQGNLSGGSEGGALRWNERNAELGN
jgi:hypothetical protein